jgi:threonine dehydrogenase-like Zn-dependent dehydrogenase
MRVARSVGVREVRLDEDPEPEAGAGEVVCRVLACGVCGSDVLDAWVARKVPAVLGHEIAAEVEQVGAGVGGVAPGDRVVVHHHAPCGECRRCRRGHETLCDQFKATRLHPGGFAERVRVPADLVGELLVLDGHALYGGEIDVCASYSAGPGDMRRALELIASGRVDPAPLVTHRLPLSETGRALELARRGEAVKALVLP